METLLPFAARAGALLKARGETVAVAESATGGLVSAALLANDADLVDAVPPGEVARLRGRLGIQG